MRGGKRMPKGSGKVLAQNRKATHDFFIEETYEAGLVLTGTEIKSIRAGRTNMKESFARIEHGEVFLYNMHVSSYAQGNQFNHDPIRTRKLLLHKKQISKLIGETKQAGYSLVPLKIYIKNGVAKVLIGLGRGKRKFDKRDDLKQKQANRDIARAIKDSNQ